MRMLSKLLAQDFLLSVKDLYLPFVRRLRTVKVLARLGISAGSPEPSLFANAFAAFFNVAARISIVILGKSETD